MIEHLTPHGTSGCINVLVETPRGATAKFKYDAKLGLFTLSRALPLGLAYPYDWGFVPGTGADDGDPLDAMVLWDSVSYPGMLLECRAIAVVNVEQTNRQTRARERNDRVLCVPRHAARFASVRGPRDLSERTRQELEHFFAAVVRFEGKQLRLIGWSGPREAQALVRRTATAAASPPSTAWRSRKTALVPEPGRSGKLGLKGRK